MKRCADCGREYTEKQSSGAYCFACKVKGISFTFHGPAGHSRAKWNNSTVESEIKGQRERIERAGGSMDDWERVS